MGGHSEFVPHTSLPSPTQHSQRRFLPVSGQSSWPTPPSRGRIRTRRRPTSEKIRTGPSRSRALRPGPHARSPRPGPARERQRHVLVHARMVSRFANIPDGVRRPGDGGVQIIPEGTATRRRPRRATVDRSQAPTTRSAPSAYPRSRKRTPTGSPRRRDRRSVSLPRRISFDTSPRASAGATTPPVIGTSISPRRSTAPPRLRPHARHAQRQRREPSTRPTRFRTTVSPCFVRTPRSPRAMGVPGSVNFRVGGSGAATRSDDAQTTREIDLGDATASASSPSARRATASR